MYGLEPSDPISWELVTGAIHEDYREWAKRNREAAIAEKRGYQFSFPIRRTDGELRFVEGTTTPLFDDAGENIGFFGVTQDITEHKQRENALQASEQRHAGILGMAPEAIISVDVDQRIQLFNKGAETIFGYSSEEIVGRRLDMLLPPSFREAHAKHIENFASTSESSEMMMTRGEILGLRKDGNEFPAEASISKLTYGGETIFTVMLRDIGQRKRQEAEKAELEQKLGQSQRMQSLGTLAGGIAHDINNMLVPMLGLTELTKDDVPAESRAHSNLEHVLEAGTRAKQLIDKILAFSRQDRDELKPIELELVVGEVLKLLRATLPATIAIQEDIDASRGTILGESTAIHQVLMNLAANAADAMGLKGGTLTVGLKNVHLDKAFLTAHSGSKPGRYVRLTVADTGCGMAEDTMEHAFDPFYTTKDVGEGAGMGLATVHGIVTNHGGVITVASEPGQGTTFELYFPVCEESVDAIPEATARRPEAHEEVLRA